MWSDQQGDASYPICVFFPFLSGYCFEKLAYLQGGHKNHQLSRWNHSMEHYGGVKAVHPSETHVFSGHSFFLGGPHVTPLRTIGEKGPLCKWHRENYLLEWVVGKYTIYFTLF